MISSGFSCKWQDENRQQKAIKQDVATSFELFLQNQFGPVLRVDLNQCLQTFLSEGHISYYTTVRGRTSYVMWLFLIMLHSTKSTNCLQIYYFFIFDKMSLRPDEMASWARFGPRASVWRPWSKRCKYDTRQQHSWLVHMKCLFFVRVLFIMGKRKMRLRMKRLQEREQYQFG